MTHLTPPQLLPSQQKHLDMLQHMASFGEVLMLVTGSPSTGKSTLAQAVAAQREAPDDTLLLAPSEIHSITDAFERIAQTWSLPALPDSADDALDVIAEYASTQGDKGASLLLIIDDAHLLPEDVLQDLAVLATIAPFALNVMLLGEHNLLEVYQNGIDTGELAVHHTALADDELADVGIDVANIPDDLHLSDIESPEHDERPKSRAIPANFPVMHATLVVALLAILGILFLYSDQLSALFTDKQALAPVEDKVLDNGQPPAVADTVTKPEASNEPKAGGKPIDFNYTPSQPPAADAIPKPAQSQPASNASVANQPPEASAIAPINNAQPVAATKAPIKAQADVAKTSEPKPNEPKQLDRSAKLVKAKEKPSVKPSVSSASSQTTKPKAAVNKTAKAASATVDQKATTQKKAVQQKAVQKKATTKTRVLDGFVVQLFGSFSASAAIDFKRQWQSKVQGPLRLYRSRHQGKPWYIVVHGVHTQRVLAEKARNQLPAALKKQSPWIRPETDIGSPVR